MVWPFFEGGISRDPWRELRQLQRDVDRLFGQYATERRVTAFPAVNMWSNEEKVHVTAEVAGIDPADLDLSVQGDQLTIRGSRTAHECAKGEVYHRRERGCGEFVRTIGMPFQVDPEKVEANYKNGILTITLFRVEQDKPKKIAIQST